MENILQKTNTTSYRKIFMFWKQICFPKNIFFSQNITILTYCEPSTRKIYQVYINNFLFKSLKIYQKPEADLDTFQLSRILVWQSMLGIR